MKRGSLILCALSTLAACAGARQVVPAPEKSLSAAPAAARVDTSGFRPIGPTGSGGGVALARSGERLVAFIADEDAHAILTFDVDAKKELASTSLGGMPSQLYLMSSGRVFALVRDANKLVELRVEAPEQPLTIVREVATPAEPVALALTPDERTLLVTAGWGQRLSAFDIETLAPRFETKLPREPRGIVVSDDGKTAFVAHAVGSVMSKVDLANAKHAATTIAMRGQDPLLKFRLEAARTRKVAHAVDTAPPEPNAIEKRVERGLESCQGFALVKAKILPNRIFAPQAMVDRGDTEKRSSGYGDSSFGAETPSVAVLDEALATPLAASTTVTRRNSFGRAGDAETDCLLPRAAAIDPQTKSLLVTCLGIDSVVAYDAASAAPAFSVRRSWNVGAGPTGIAIDSETRQAVVFSQFDRSVSVLTLDDGELTDDKSAPPTATARTNLAAPAGWSLSRALGRVLFHTSGDRRISSDGRACASCHPDGRDDAITWATPEGPRRSIMLAGRVGTTAPYSWDGNAVTIDAHLTSTFRRLRGTGLRPYEREALVGYVSSLPAPPTGAIDNKTIVARGREIFHSTKAGCATCHAGAGFTDGVNHDVGSKHSADSAGSFNTPSLHLVGGTGPYFHDGRYATLPELLRKSDGKMGNTKHLTNADIDALASYIQTL